METATTELRRNGQMLVDRMEYASLDHLRLRLLAEDYHIFHYLGFARLDEQAKRPFLVMRSRDRGFIDADDLKRELYPESTVRLVVLTPGRQSFQPMCAFAAQLGLTATTLQFPVSHRASVLFFRQFYGALTEVAGVDIAMGRTRRTLAHHLPTGEWAAPVLYTNQLTNRLFYHLNGGRPAARQA
jgi:hypothetical protein